jgi:predicted HicB family RNase H-like nuclease
MPASKAQQKAVAKYMKSNYDELKVRIEIGKKADLQTHAAGQRESLNGFVNRAIDETVERDKTKDTAKGDNDGQ